MPASNVVTSGECEWVEQLHLYTVNDIPHFPPLLRKGLGPPPNTLFLGPSVVAQIKLNQFIRHTKYTKAKTYTVYSNCNATARLVLKEQMYRIVTGIEFHTFGSLHSILNCLMLVFTDFK